MLTKKLHCATWLALLIPLRVFTRRRRAAGFLRGAEKFLFLMH
jgi:hypothetical protein